LKSSLADNLKLYPQAIEAAQSYVAKLAPGDVVWPYSKPFLAAGTNSDSHAQALGPVLLHPCSNCLL
jgi:hypothetical protein